jgi:hypothetical protein
MPDQPADPIHYDTKIPPEKKLDEPMPGNRVPASGPAAAQPGPDRKEDQGREDPAPDPH